MGLDDLKEVIEKLQGRITNHKDYLQKEPRTRTLLVDPLLRELGWDVENPNLVELEYEPESSKRMSADYILRNGKNNIAIVEAKPIGKTIEDLGVLEQAEKYASSAGAPFIILTNGSTWLLYKRSSTASLASLSPIISFDIERDEPYYCVSACISMWLPNLSSGSPKEAMTPVLDSPDDKMKIDPTAPPAPALAIKKAGKLPVKQLYLEYWTALKNHFEQRDKPNNDIKFIKTLPQCFMPFAVGHSGFHIHTWASRDKRYINVGLTVKGAQGKSHFDRLKVSKKEIESEISPELDWQENPKENYIRLYLEDTDLENRDD